MGKKLGKSEKSSLAGVDFDELNHKVMGVSKNIKGPKKTPHGPVQCTPHPPHPCPGQRPHTRSRLRQRN